MTARVIRHSSGVVSIEPVHVLEDRAVDLVLRVFGDDVVAIHQLEIDEARSRHPSTPKGTAA